MSRERLPDRRASWISKARIGGQTFYLQCGEYPDGSLGEIFIDAHKEGTFTRGVLGALARMTSLALQCGVEVTEVVKALGHLNFPPNGPVHGEDGLITMNVVSVCDWVSQTIEEAYVKAKGGE
jgi:ribonucleoside-diphosphate reductase alpha chain